MGKVQLKKNREFGYVIAAALLVICIFGYIKGKNFNIYIFSFAVLFVILATLVPLSLTYLEIVWRKLGLLLGRINSTLLLILIYFFLFIPIGFLLKLFKKDPLKKRFDPDIATYWDKKEQTAGLEKMKYQF